jgi:hypothetical protein
MDLGYQALVEDACGSMAAVKERSVERCDALSVSAVRDGCRRRLAIVERSPDVCPAGRGRLPGREPICIAWATRSIELCQTTDAADRPRCEAVLLGDERHCARSLQRAQCAAEVRRYSSIVSSGDENNGARTVATSFAIDVVQGETPTTVSADVSRGVFLSADGCRHVVEIASMPARIGDDDAPRVTLTLHVPHGSTLPVTLAFGPAGQATLEIEGGGLSVHSLAGTSGAVTLRRWSTERGDPLEGDISASVGVVRIRGTLQTFVRDVEQLAESCAPPPPAVTR